ncbi:hypothetical protein [Prauserella rugosa]|uniref:Uncharacterized protein n=1 Tax=Prauserella rugosa TaxID=43354 RepID=A0A660CD26_9PSEU|nr:hypothetical protein [Prauserella rugosa]KMS92330.1 hypothetical protein ACZ91_04795 [Streptomyces regensis]TWH20304.1 hypothetical protein JD82_02147 [Prauserella rugosa]
MPTESWTGRTACALQRAFRFSHERFAAHLDIGVRTVASWHQNPGITPKSNIQQLLETAYERVSASVRQRFSDELGGAADADSGPTDTAAHADAERRLTADPNMSAALEWLDTYSDREAGAHRQQVAERLAAIDARELRDRGTRRGGVTSAQVAYALEQYYGRATGGYGRYTASVAGKHVSTTILTRPEWLDLACPLATTSDGLVFDEQDRGALTVIDELTTDAAVTRLAETLELGMRLVNMPLYGLESVQVGADGIGGCVGVVPFVEYALTMDLLEGELLDALASGNGLAAGELPLRDRFLPELSSVADPSSRVCTGGALALCAIARPAGLHGDADYLLLVQQRSGNVLNANRQLSVIPKGFHQPMADLRGDTRLGLTLLREAEEELFGRDDIDNTLGDQRSADPMHPSRLTAPMRWLLERPVGERIRMECTAFGFNLVSGNYEFPSLIVIEDEEFWVQYGGQVEANWEASNLRRYSTRDPELLTELISEVTWSNEGLFAFLQGLRRLSEIGGQRVKLPSIAWETR